MNSLNILLNYDYISKLFTVTWTDILFGINERFLESESAIEYAYKIIESEEEPSQLVMDVAFSNKGEYLKLMIQKLVAEEELQDEKITKDKYLYAVLYWVYHNRDLYSEPLEAVECIYADFDYPEEIAELVRYNVSLKKENLSLKHIYEKWVDYLNKKKYI